MEPAAHDSAARSAVELAVRSAYGRLLATVAARWRDVAAAEDALAEALAAALRTWPADGVPARPEAWLIAAARRRLIDAGRRAAVRERLAPDLTRETERWLAHAEETDSPLPDQRLALLFVCAHPAIAPDARTPLMLQTVLGLDAARIAGAFALPAATMGQRLVRAKNRIRDAGIGFRVPDVAEWSERLPAVLDAIYAAFGTGWDEVHGADAARGGLAAEAIWLGRALVQLCPDEPEARGLLALMLHCDSRRAARRDAGGRYVPLSAQDPRRWDSQGQAEAEEHLRAAARAGRPGRYQLEAAIQSVHAARAATGRTDWPALVLLYGELVRVTPAIGARLGHAAARAETGEIVAALAVLEGLPVAETKLHQPYWALRAHLLDRLGRSADSAAARARAIELSADPAVRAFLAR